MAIGARGVVSVLANILPCAMKDMLETRSHTAYRALYPLICLTQCESNPIPVKVMMQMLDQDSGICRPPLTPITEGCHKRIYQELVALGHCKKVMG